MRILYLHTPGNNLAGSEIVMMNILDGLKHNTEQLIVLPEEGIFYDQLEQKGLNVDVLPLRNFNRYQPTGYFKCLWPLFKTIRHFKPNIIHTSSAAPVQYAYPLAKVLRIPLICHIQCLYGKDDLRRYFPHLADQIVVISESVKAIFPEKYQQKIKKIYNGISIPSISKRDARQYLISKYNLKQTTKIIGMVGQLIPRKGHELLIRSLPEIVRNHPETQLLIAGDDTNEYAKEIKQISGTLGLKDHIIWTGYLKKTRYLMAGLDGLIVPSTSEGFGLVAAEAQAAGTPVVASATGGLMEIIIGDHTGYFFPSGNMKRLAERVNELLSDLGMASVFGENGRQKVQREFSKTNQIQKIYQLYLSLLKPNKISVQNDSGISQNPIYF